MKREQNDGLKEKSQGSVEKIVRSENRKREIISEPFMLRRAEQ